MRTIFFRKIKTLFTLLSRNTLRLIFNDVMCLFWCDSIQDRNNFGDIINPFLFGKLTGSEVVSRIRVLNFLNRPTYFFIGSILDNLNCKNSIICGAGFMYENASIKMAPKKIIAVRGPLSRKIFLKEGLVCPEVYCDPALLLPYVLPSKNQKKDYDIGIIPHYIDKVELNKIKIINKGFSYKILDIESNPQDLIDSINKCKFVFSSSLHGIVLAHAYRIPATWITLSENIGGKGFKFYDYYSSIGEKEPYNYNIVSVLDLEIGIKNSKCYDVLTNVQQFVNELNKMNLLNIKYTPSKIMELLK